MSSIGEYEWDCFSTKEMTPGAIVNETMWYKKKKKMNKFSFLYMLKKKENYRENLSPHYV